MGHAPLRLILLIVLGFAPASGFAQDWSQPWADPMDRPPRVDISASGGFLMPTRWSDLVLIGSISPASGILEQVLTRDVHVKPDSAFTASTTYWRGGYGFRARAGFSRSSLKIAGTSLVGSSSPSTPALDVSSEIASVG